MPLRGNASPPDRVSVASTQPTSENSLMLSGLACRSVSCGWMSRVSWGFALTCRRRVLLSGASIDGSLWYGDLPAQTGPEMTDIA